jgi:hypothetical protein
MLRTDLRYAGHRVTEGEIVETLILGTDVTTLGRVLSRRPRRK